MGGAQWPAAPAAGEILPSHGLLMYCSHMHLDPGLLTVETASLDSGVLLPEAGVNAEWMFVA